MSSLFESRDITARRRRFAATFAAAAVLFVWMAGSASAHAVLLRTTPETDGILDGVPDSVTLEYSEPVDLALGAVRVFDSAAERVEAGEADHPAGEPEVVTVPLQSDLPEGTYTVTWQVISGDSHPIRGAFVFHIGAPGARPEGIAEEVLGAGAGRVTGVLFGTVRWVSFSAMLVFTGALAFAVIVWRQERVISRPIDVETAFGRRWRRIVAWSGATLLIGTVLTIPFQGAVAAGVPLWEALDPNVISEVLGTRFGTMALLRVALLLAGCALWFAARRSPVPLLRTTKEEVHASVGAAAAGATIPPWAIAGGALLLVGLILTPGLAGHASVASPAALNVAVDGVHVGAAALWIGGLVALLGGAFPAARSAPGILAPVVLRYSALAVWSVAVLVITGTFRGWIEIRFLDAVTGSTYGLVLIAKVGLFLPLLALGAINNRKRIPRIASSGDEREHALGRLRRTVVVEVAIAVAVVAVTAALVNTPPPRSEEATTPAGGGQVMAEGTLGDNDLEVHLDPAVVGANMLDITVTDASGEPAEIEKLTARFFMEEQDIGPLVVAGHQVAPGQYMVHGAQLAVGGEWRVEIIARFDRFTQERATVELTVGG